MHTNQCLQDRCHGGTRRHCSNDSTVVAVKVVMDTYVQAFSSVDVKKARSLEQSLKQANREKRAKQRELDRLEIQMNMTSKQMQERLLASLDEREEMENRIEDLGK